MTAARRGVPLAFHDACSSHPVGRRGRRNPEATLGREITARDRAGRAAVADEEPAGSNAVESWKMQRANKKEEQRISSVDRIMKCALDLFVTNGYRATTVEMIGVRAKLTKGAIYFYFKSKEAILLRLLEDAETTVVDPALAGDTASPALDRLVGFLNQQSNVALSHPQHLLLLILMSVEFYGTNTEIEVRVRAIYLRFYAYIDGLMRQGQSEGSIRTDIRSHELTALVMAQHDGTLIEWYRRPGELEGKNWARVARLTLLDGVKARS